nr:serine/threonine-protein kinase Nek2-like [Biomphalaria glabrata]
MFNKGVVQHYLYHVMGSGVWRMYTIVQKLGQGAFGQVYHLNVIDGNEFALKVVSTHKLVELEDRKLDSEAKLMTKLCHPHLVQCCAYFMDSQSLYLVTEFCNHGNLREYLSNLQTKAQHVHEETVLKWLGQMADALRYLHDSRIIHRDIKPDNIFLHSSQHIKIGDLGIARELDSTNQKLDTLIGTYLYMSPELLSGESYTTKTDIWSLGCCIHEVMTLSPTFKAESIAEVVNKVTRGKIGPMPNIYQQVLRQLVQTILTVKPKFRPDATDILFYVCQIQGKPYSSGPHKPLEKVHFDTKSLSKALKDFEEQLSGVMRPLPKPRKKKSRFSSSKLDKEKIKQINEPDNEKVDVSLSANRVRETPVSESHQIKTLEDDSDFYQMLQSAKSDSDSLSFPYESSYKASASCFKSLIFDSPASLNSFIWNGHHFKKLVKLTTSPREMMETMNHFLRKHVNSFFSKFTNQIFVLK